MVLSQPMRRLIAWVFTLGAVLSLLLCVGACALWARSPTTLDEAVYASAGGAWTLQTAPHRLELLRLEHQGPAGGWQLSSTPRRGPGVNSTWLPPAKQGLGFGWEARTLSPQLRYWRAVVPFWFVVAVLLCAPALRVSGALRRRRRGDGNRCVSCGYDLRASAGRCPECGTATPA